MLATGRPLHDLLGPGLCGSPVEEIAAGHSSTLRVDIRIVENAETDRYVARRRCLCACAWATSAAQGSGNVTVTVLLRRCTSGALASGDGSSEPPGR